MEIKYVFPYICNMKLQHILMADVINSRKYKGRIIANALSSIVTEVNEVFEKEIVSPLTITLGDEFQGIVSSQMAAIKIILYIEELIINKECGFKLRYATNTGKIDTAINKKIAHGMIGEGLSETRAILNNAKKEQNRFFLFKGIKANFLNDLFILFTSFIDNWKKKDFKTIGLFLAEEDYKKVAVINNNTPSAMWKKKKSLQIKEYKTVKHLILEYASSSL
jgi:SatD family (SatD)